MILYFPHIPKAGGSTLREIFFRKFQSNKIIKVWNTRFGADLDAGSFQNLDYETLKLSKAIMGHLPLKYFIRNHEAKKMLCNGDIKIITCVRDPVRRLTSLYNFIKFNKNHRKHLEMQNTGLVDFIYSQEENFQFNYLSCELAENIGEVNDLMKISSIDSSIENFQLYFKTHLGFDPGPVDIKNSITKFSLDNPIAKMEDIPHNTLAKLYKKHYVDHSLYEQSLQTTF
ncbi:MAG: sulfotransferase family 2 domain-containing protein [Lentisphaerales bacterium]|nr:sulfotransferase family 2 domain-containing protein [Lentisphaerales bacterium]